MKNVVAYCSVSAEKENDSNSLEAQKAFFYEYAERNHMNLARIYADKDISGMSEGKRVAFNQMMEDSKKGGFDFVLVNNISRLARNTVELQQIIRKLKAHDIAIKFVTESMETLFIDDSIFAILMVMRQEESRRTE